MGAGLHALPACAPRAAPEQASRRGTGKKSQPEFFGKSHPARRKYRAFPEGPGRKQGSGRPSPRRAASVGAGKGLRKGSPTAREGPAGENPGAEKRPPSRRKNDSPGKTSSPAGGASKAHGTDGPKFRRQRRTLQPGRKNMPFPACALPRRKKLPAAAWGRGHRPNSSAKATLPAGNTAPSPRGRARKQGSGRPSGTSTPKPEAGRKPKRE